MPEAARNRSRYGLAGLILSGLAFTCLASLLLAWGYHLSSDYDLIGSFFLALNAGLLVGVQLSRPALERLAAGPVLAAAALLGSGSFAGLVFAEPPVAAFWRHGLLLLLGVSTGALNAVLFEFLTPAYRRAPTATVNLGSLAFIAGAVLGSQSVAGSIGGYSLWIPVAAFSLIYAAFGTWVWAGQISEKAVVRKLPAEARRDFRSFGAVLFAMVLFFQFGTEISLGSWLPLMLVQTVGMSPAAALGMLTLYWLALLAGRAMAQGAQSRMRNRHLLPLGVASALLGCLILAVTDNRFGSVMAILFCGVGFAVVYPVLVEIVGDRFRYYHPVYFNGVFSIALTGGLLAPWVTGLVAGALGIRLAMLIPLAGTLVVAMLLIVIWIGTQARKAEV